jgi:hypothetical protein
MVPAPGLFSTRIFCGKNFPLEHISDNMRDVISPPPPTLEKVTKVNGLSGKTLASTFPQPNNIDKPSISDAITTIFFMTNLLFIVLFL